MHLTERPGQQPRPRLQTIAQRTRALAPKKESWRSRAHFFQPARSAKPHENRATTQHTEDALKTSIGVSPSLFRAWRFNAPSAHPREAESDSFLACGANQKQRLAAARTRRRMPSLSSALVGACQLGVVWRAAGFPIS